MVNRLRFSLLLVLLVSLVFAVPAFAGGWAVITLDEWPSGVVAGEPITIGFTVLQHGRTPMAGLTPAITATLYKDREFVVSAEPEGEPGHYTATLSFPKEGDWQWSIQAFTMDQAMPMLNVAAPGGVAAESGTIDPVSAVSFLSPMILASVALLALGLVCAGVGLRRRNRGALALTALCLVAGITLFFVGAGTAPGVAAKAKAESVAVDASPAAQVELGKKLFIAKGCITCHVNTKAARPSEYWTIEMGAPNLSKFSASPEVLMIRLKDPSAAKSDTQMPNLGLDKNEIEALIAFLNAK